MERGDRLQPMEQLCAGGGPPTGPIAALAALALTAGLALRVRPR